MNQDISRTLKSERGNILVVTLLILFAVSVIGGSVAMISSTDLKISGNQRMTTQAMHAAEAGLTEAVHRLAMRNPTVMTVGGWTGNVAIADVAPYDPLYKVQLYMVEPGQAPAPPAGSSIVNTGTLQDLGSDHVTYSAPDGTEGVLTVEHKWRDRNADGIRDADEVVLYDALRIPPENFTSGFPVEIVTVTGRRGVASRAIEAEVTRRTLMARTLGALYVDKAIEVTGSPEFCGHNHNILTPVWTAPNGCFAWHETSGHLAGITTTGDNVDVSGNGSDIIGDPTPTDTSSTNPFYDIHEILGISSSELTKILGNADNTTVVSPMDGITFIDGDAKINSNTTGEGLLYIKGDLEASGSFTFKGMIYVEGDVKLTGGPWILGTMVIRGKTDYNFGAGSGAFLYSRDAILDFVGSSFPVLMLSWREL